MTFAPDTLLANHRKDQRCANGVYGCQRHHLKAVLPMAGSLGNCRSLLPR